MVSVDVKHHVYLLTCCFNASLVGRGEVAKTATINHSLGSERSDEAGAALCRCECDRLLCAVCCGVGCVGLCCFVLFVVESDVLVCVALCLFVVESDVLVCVMSCCFVTFVLESDVLVCVMLCCLESYLLVCAVFV